MDSFARELFLKGVNYYYGSNGYPLNYQKAFEYLQEAANQGSSDAMNILGVMYEKGDFLTRNYAQAFGWFDKAVNNNPKNQKALYNIGRLYYTGLGVVKNTTKALEYLKSAIMLGKNSGFQSYPYACLIAGEILLLIQKKNRESYYYFFEAAKYGDIASAWHNLGYLTEQGIVPQNSPAAHSKVKRDTLASDYYKKAAGLGYADSMVSVARIYMNYSMRYEAEEWLEKAICAGHPKAKTILKAYKFGRSGSVLDLFG